MAESSGSRWRRDALEGKLVFDFPAMTCTIDAEVFDLRRSGDGVWEARPKQEHWQRSIERFKRTLETPLASPSDHEDYEEVTGENYDTASARGIDILGRLPAAPWENMGDVAPVVEAAYQEFRRRG